MDYASRLANLNLSSLEYRRVYFDLSMCSKIVNKVLMQLRCILHLRKFIQSGVDRHDFQLYFFTSRVVPIWNSLPQHVVYLHTISFAPLQMSSLDLSPFCKLYPFNKIVAFTHAITCLLQCIICEMHREILIIITCIIKAIKAINCPFLRESMMAKGIKHTPWRQGAPPLDVSRPSHT